MQVNAISAWSSTDIAYKCIVRQVTLIHLFKIWINLEISEQNGGVYEHTFFYWIGSSPEKFWNFHWKSAQSISNFLPDIFLKFSDILNYIRLSEVYRQSDPIHLKIILYWTEKSILNIFGKYKGKHIVIFKKHSVPELHCTVQITKLY